MPHQDVPNVVKVQINWKNEFSDFMNTFYVHAVNAITEALLDALWASVETWLNTYWQPIATDRVGVISATLTDLTSLNGRRKVYTPANPIRGGLNEEPMPANVTVAVKASVGHRGRGKNGRMFWVGLTETQVAGDTLRGGFDATLLTAMQGLKTVVEGTAGFDHIVIPHFVVGGIRPPIVQTENLEAYQLTDSFTDSQRDRLPNHRKHKRRIIV